MKRIFSFCGASVLALTGGVASASPNIPPAMTVAHAGSAYRFALHDGSNVLYDQSADSGFAKYAVPSWYNNSSYAPNSWHDHSSSYAPYSTPDIAADDFVIPGTGTHHVTAVYAAGVTDFVSWVDVTFFSKLKFSKKTGMTTAIVKAICQRMPVQGSGNGDLLVDVSSCDTGAFKAGHDYGVSVQASSSGEVWYWQTNRKRINGPGLWWDYGGGGSGSCYEQLTPIKTCFPTRGYGPDLAFAIIGN